MSQPHVLAVDQGTTNTKALLVDADGRVVARASRPVAISFPQPGWVEQDGRALWQTVEDAVGECLAQAPGRTVSALGISNQRESALVWDRATGAPLGPVIVWQCRRTAGWCDELRTRGVGPELEARTGLTIDPLFSASKIRWLLDAIPDGQRRAEAGELCAGTVDSWLVWNLTGGAVHACDVTNASRTQLLDLERGDWSDALAAIFGIPRAVLPAVRPSSGVLGEARAIGTLPAGTPIASAIGDSHAALFGQAAFEPGPVKATYGTGSSLMTRVDAPVRSRHGLSTTVAWAIGGTTAYALEGNVTVTGGAVDWLRQFLGLTDATDVAALARSVDDAGGAVMVPAFAGLGAPYWDAGARGLLSGLTRGTTAAHVARATLESIAFQIRDVVEALRADGVTPSALLADGGASRNDDLMQLQADLLGCPVVRSESADLSASGAAWLAGLAMGVWPSLDALAALPRPVTRFEPAMPPEVRDRRYAAWREAVARAASRPAGTEA